MKESPILTLSKLCEVLSQIEKTEKEIEYKESMIEGFASVNNDLFDKLITSQQKKLYDLKIQRCNLEILKLNLEMSLYDLDEED